MLGDVQHFLLNSISHFHIPPCKQQKFDMFHHIYTPKRKGGNYVTCQRIGERRAAIGSGGGLGVSSGRTYSSGGQ